MNESVFILTYQIIPNENVNLLNLIYLFKTVIDAFKTRLI